METRLLSRDDDAGITTWWNYDLDSDITVIEKQQDITGLVSDNKAFYASIKSHDPWYDGLGSRVASIPLCIYYDLKRKGVLDDQKYMRRWLNDPDNRVFRTRPGRI